jgi:flagellin-like hook-associated protein FlgL
MRITQRAVALTSLQGLNRNLDSLSRLQQQLTSGKQISSPSDSPTGTNRAMQTRSDQAAVDQQARNITDAKSWLEQTDSTLLTMVEQVRRVRDLAVQGLNGGSSAASQEALATEVASIREGLIALANTSVRGRPLFGGGHVDRQGLRPRGELGRRRLGASDAAGVGHREHSDRHHRAEAFGGAPNDLFDLVDRIATDLTTAGPAALSVDLQDLDTVMEGMLSAVADVGSRGTRIENLEQINVDRALALSSQLATTEDIDMPETIMRLQMVQVGYQAALSATSKAIQPTLLDYLR